MPTTEQIKEAVLQELPRFFETDLNVQNAVLTLSRRHFADRHQTEGRIERMLDELRRDREENSRNWKENSRRWDENNRKWEKNQQEIKQLRNEHNARWEENQQEIKQLRNEHNARWEENQQEIKQLRNEHNARWEENQQEIRDLRNEHDARWEKNQQEIKQLRNEHDARWEKNQQEIKQLRNEHNARWKENQQEIRDLRNEHNARWEKNQQVIRDILAEIKEVNRKHDSSIGALGARWGLNTEASFRSALKGILEECAAVEVLNVTEFDDDGIVFGRPDQVELDIIIRNGMLIIVEIKSSMSKGDMYILDRKAMFYEQRHQRKPTRVIVISPMVAPNAMPVAEKLGIEVHSNSRDVKFDEEGKR